MRAAVAVVGWLACVWPATGACEPGPLESLRVPGGVAAAMRMLGDVRRPDPALFADDLIRRVYNQPADAVRSQDPTLATVLAWMHEQRRAAAAATESAAHPLVPSPLSPSAWRALLGHASEIGHDVEVDFGHVLASHDASLLYVALLRMPAEGRAWWAAHPERLREVLPHAATLTIAAPWLDRDASGWRLPGGPRASRVWAGLAGRDLADPRLPLALVSAEHGWLAVLADALGDLAEPQQHAALGLAPADPETAGRLLRALRAAAPDWVPRQRPFWRPTLDAVWLLRLIDADARGPRLPGTRADWRVLFAGQPPAPSRAASGDPAAPSYAWLIEQVYRGSADRRRRAYDQVLFAARQMDAASGDRTLDPDLAVAIASMATRPQLVLTLERLGLRSRSSYRAAVEAAQALEAATSPQGAHPARHGVMQLQAALALLVAARREGAVNDARIDADVRAVCEAAVRGGDALVRWLRRRVTSARSDEPATLDASLDAAVVQWASGPARGQVTWEGATYTIDPAGATAARLERLRGNGVRRLDLADTLARRVASGTSRDDLRAWVAAHRPDARDAADVSEAWRVVDAAWRQAEVGTPSAALDLVDALTTTGLMELVYALAMGTGDELPLRPDEAARRHLTSAPYATDTLLWTAPVIVVDEGTRWHVRGSLLGLDIALAPLTLRRVSQRLPPRRPTLNTADRRVFIESVPLVARADLDDPRLASAAADALARGRMRVDAARRSVEGCVALGEALPATSRRRAVHAWRCLHAPDTLGDALSVVETLAMGVGERARAGVDDGAAILSRPDSTLMRCMTADAALGGWPCAFGAAAHPVTGANGLWQPPTAWRERASGRWGTGVSAGVFPDLHLVALAHIGALGLPATLLPEALASVTWEFVTRVPAAYPDDWIALQQMAWDVDIEAVERALALQTAGGVLRAR